MKKSILLILVFIWTANISAQNYDLIVTSDKDSLACHIDSITDSHIYFEMRHNNNWIHTLMKKEQILEFKKDAVGMKGFDFKKGSSYITTRKSKFVEGYHHAHKLMFAPTSFPLKQGDFYYNTNYFLIHNFQVGITDHVSFDFGTTLFAIPAYGLLNFTYPVSDKIAFSVGDLAIFDTWIDPGVIGNLAYGLVSIGTEEKSLNIGAGYLYLGEYLSEKTNAPAFTISGQVKIGKRSYLLTEHYAAVINYEYWPDIENYASLEEYIIKGTFIGGLTGIRLTGKRNPRLSWQLGVAEIILIDQKEIPEFYNNPGSDNHLVDGKVLFRPYPVISFSYIFGKRFK